MLAYNHEAFIKQAIESVLMQEADFGVELVIGEDCSTDGTRAIVEKFAGEHPDRIKLVLAARNRGWRANYNACLDACRGEYIALLEGDDYWITKDKLQKQVDFLLGHEECVLCFTRVCKFTDPNIERGNLLPLSTGRACPQHTSSGLAGQARPAQGGHRSAHSITPSFPVKPISGIEDILAKQFVQTCTVMYRRSAFEGMPDWFEGLRLGDWPSWVLLAQRGKLGFLDEVTAAYRVHPGGLWSGADSMTACREIIRMLEKLGQHIEPRYRGLVRTAISRESFELAWLLREAGKHNCARKAISRCLSLRFFNPQLSFFRVLMLWLRYHAPPIYLLASAFTSR